MSFTRNHRYPSVKKRFAIWAALFSVGTLAMPATALASNERESLTTDSERYFKSEDIFNLEYVSEVQVSPNGKYVAYVRRSNDIMSDSSRANVWLASVDGKSHRPYCRRKRVTILFAGHQTVAGWLTFLMKKVNRNCMCVGWIQGKRHS